MEIKLESGQFVYNGNSLKADWLIDEIRGVKSEDSGDPEEVMSGEKNQRQREVLFMRSRLLNWKGTATPDTPGYVHLFCSINRPNAGVTVLFTDQSNPNSELLVGHYARSVGRWEVASMLETERALVVMPGCSSSKPSGMLEVKLFDWDYRSSPNGGDRIALRLIEGAISNIAERLIDSGVRIWPSETMPMISYSLPDELSPLADEPEQIKDILRFDSEIESISEDPADEKLVYYLKCLGTATPRQGSRFKAIVFSGYHFHQMEKTTHVEGHPKIIDISEESMEGPLTLFRIETNAGDRFISAQSAYVTRSSIM